MSAMSAILLVTLLLAAAAAASGQEQGSLPVHGRVVVPGEPPVLGCPRPSSLQAGSAAAAPCRVNASAAAAAACWLLTVPTRPCCSNNAADGVSLAQAEVWLQLESGERRVAFPLPDGAFTFADVPLGVHTLSVEQQQLLYPTLRLDVGVGRKGKVSAVAIDVTGVSALAWEAGAGWRAEHGSALGLEPRRAHQGGARLCLACRTPPSPSLQATACPPRCRPRRCRRRCWCGRWR